MLQKQGSTPTATRPQKLKAGNNSNGSGRLFFETNIRVAEEVQRVHDLDLELMKPFKMERPLKRHVEAVSVQEHMLIIYK